MHDAACTTRVSAWAGHNAASPTWITFTVTGVLIMLVLIAAVVPLLSHDAEPGSDDEGQPGPGRHGPRLASADVPPPQDGIDPEWWTEFERLFAAYVEAHKARVR